MPEPYRRLDTAVLEALVLKGPLGLTEDDIAHLHGLGYSRTDDEALELVLVGRVRRRLLPALDPGRAGARHRGGRREHAPQVDVLLPQGPDGAALQSAAITRSRRSNSMKATATRDSGYRHVVRVRSHDLSVDEPTETGGERRRPEPAGAAGREPRLVHRGHDGDVRRRARAGTSAASRSRASTRPPSAAARPGSGSSCASPTRSPTSRSSACGSSPPSAPCTARSTARSCSTSVSSASRSRTELARALRAVLLDAGEAAALDVHGRIDAAVLVPLYVAGRRAARRLHPPPRGPAPPPRRDLVPRRAPGRRRDRPAADRPARGRGGDRPARARGRARRRAAADADHRHQLRRLPLRRAHRARPRVGALGHARSPR